MTTKALAMVTLVATCFPFAAVADDSTVQIYGTLLPFFDNARTRGATEPGLSPANGGATQVPAGAYTGLNAPGRNRLSAGTSNIGFRGSEDLGGDLKAIFQIESGVPLDGDPAPNTFASRNSHVGLAGAWGTVFLGNWDTPYKSSTLALAPLRGLNPFDYDNLLENPGFGVPATTTQGGRAGSKADAAFSRRQGNSVQYWTPTLAGFSARLAYSANEGKSALIDPALWSVSLAWANGPVTVRYAYERHDDYFGLAQLGGSAGASPTNSSSTDEGHKLMGMVSLGSTKISAVWERLRYDTDDSLAGAVRRYQRDAYFVQLQQRLGPSSLWLSYGLARDGSCERVAGQSCVTDGLGARQWTLGYAYSLSKRTDAYAAVYGVSNDRSASYGVFPSVGTTAPGADTRALGLGLLHVF